MPIGIPLGQESVLGPVLAAGRRGRLAQSWLLTGPAGIGKRSAARLMVAAQFCARPSLEGVPCGACRSCQRVAEGTHVDLHWTDASGKLGVEEARAFSHAAGLCPDGTVSAFVMEACDRLTPAGAAALLKTLEDPPGPAIFILLTEHPDRVEPTLRSRCQLLRLRPLAPSVLAAWLSAGPARDWDESAVLRLATAAGGVVGQALQLLECATDRPPEDSLPAFAAEIEAALRATSLAQAVALAGRLATAGATVEVLLAVLRDLMLLRAHALLSAGGPLGVLSPDTLRSLLPDWDPERLAAACAACATASEGNAFHVNATLTWEWILIGLRRWRTVC